MAREIHEQPTALAGLVSESVVADRTTPVPFAIPAANLEWGVDLVACGTAHFAGMIGERWIEEIAGIRARAEIASEFRYRPMPASERALAVFISQSGETADTLAALELCRDAGRPTVGIVNAKGSTLDRAADASFDILAGREISVASTKAFTSTLAALLRLSWSIATARTAMASEMSSAIANALSEAPRLVAETLARESAIQEAAASFVDAPLVLYLGRGPMHVVALEGALKLKEISYIHAEGFPGGRTQARANCTGRRQGARGRSRTQGLPVRENHFQHAGGHRARRKSDSGLGREGNSPCRPGLRQDNRCPFLSGPHCTAGLRSGGATARVSCRSLPRPGHRQAPQSREIGHRRIETRTGKSGPAQTRNTRSPIGARGVPLPSRHAALPARSCPPGARRLRHPAPTPAILQHLPIGRAQHPQPGNCPVRAERSSHPYVSAARGAGGWPDDCRELSSRPTESVA